MAEATNWTTNIRFVQNLADIISFFASVNVCFEWLRTGYDSVLIRSGY